MTEETYKPFEKEFGKGDIVLVSSDRKRLVCHKEYLSTGSRVFHDMFSLSKSQSAEATPEVQMAESYSCLERLIPHAYPQRLGPVFSDDNTASLRVHWEIADKLDIARAVDSIETALLQEHKLKQDTFKTYVFACKHGLDRLVIALVPHVTVKEAMPTLNENHADLGSFGISRLLTYWTTHQKLLATSDVAKNYKGLVNNAYDHYGQPMQLPQSPAKTFFDGL